MAESQEIAARGAQVEALLAKKDIKSAINLSLQNPPISSKSDEIKASKSFRYTQIKMLADIIYRFIVSSV